ncbi:unnamed protein product, partial [Amoebophrya sp. A25]
KADPNNVKTAVTLSHMKSMFQGAEGDVERKQEARDASQRDDDLPATDADEAIGGEQSSNLCAPRSKPTETQTADGCPTGLQSTARGSAIDEKDREAAFHSNDELSSTPARVSAVSVTNRNPAFCLLIS